MIQGPETNSSTLIPPTGNSTDKPLAFGFVIPAPKPSDPNPETAGAARRNKKHCLAFQSPQMNELVQLATRFAKSSASILITGESGTGKELFSRLIHEKSGRPKSRFHAFNCAAVPEALIESEIFGHERGAFTGALQKRIGYFERANGGTLLLDEISEIPVTVQAKLLRVLEEQEVQPLGSECVQKIDVRIVATSNRDLKQEVAEGRFRADLFHRLNVLQISIPPLRDRVADIPLLVLNFMEQFRCESQIGIKKIDQQAMAALCRYRWPGNVRELRNVIHRACILAVNGVITKETLPDLESTAQTRMTLWQTLWQDCHLRSPNEG